MSPAKRMASAHGASGMHQALAEAYEAHFDFVWRSLRRLGVPADGLEDAAQDVFVVAARKIHEFEGRAKVRTWLFAIAQRVAMRKRRDAFRHHRRTEAVEREHAHFDAGHVNPTAAQDAATMLASMLEQLDEAQRLVFVLVEIEGMTAVEVAESLGANVNTVYSRIRSAKKRMQALAEKAKAS